MDAQQFLAEFGHIANAPGGVARLRELVLQLAISGRLTERVRDDIPAAELIDLNKREQTALLAKKAIKRQPDPSAVEARDHPWRLPEGWAWTRLGSVTNYGDAPKIEFDDVTQNTWVLELEDVEKKTSTLLARVSARERKFKSTKNGFPAGAVLYGKLRPYLDKVLIADSPGVCTTEISPISFFSQIDARYLRWYLKSPYFIAYADGSTYGMNLPRLGTDAAREALFPFPPQREQSSIVAKVNELMSLCGRLEQHQQDRRKLQNALRQSTLQALSSAESPHELQESWQRLQGTFGHLFSEPADVEDFRRFILTLAAQGKLASVSATTRVGTLASILLGASVNGVSKGPTRDTSATEVLKISAGTSRADFNVDEDDFKHVALSAEEIERFRLMPGDLLACRFNGNLRFVGRFSYYRGLTGRTQVNPDKLIRFRISPEHDPRYICLTMNAGPARQAIEAMCATTAGNIGLSAGRLKTVEIPLPSLTDQRQIVERVSALMQICEELETRLLHATRLAQSFGRASIAKLTGTAIEQEEEKDAVKAPQTELIAPLRLGTLPDVKDQAPLATLLARNHGEMSARDLWQRFGGEIDAFYAQLKTEVAHGWITEPPVAEVRAKPVETVGA